jgi:PAS domain S-box-containing protein
LIAKKHETHLEDDAALVVGHEQSFEWVVRRMSGVVYRCLADEHLSMQALTHGVADLLGYPASDFIDNVVRSYASVIHPDERSQVTHELRVMLERGSAEPERIEYRVVTADGRERWVQHEVWVVRDERGAPAWLEGFIVDITEHHRLQLAEAERHAAYQRQQRALVALATSAWIAAGQVEELASLATEVVVGAVEVERASVWLLDTLGTQLELVDLYKRTPAIHERGLTLAAKDYPSYFAAMNTGRAVVADDAFGDPCTAEFADTYLRPEGIVALLDAAIRIGGEVVGVVCLEQTGEARPWQRHEIDFAGEVADQLSLALHNRGRLAALAREQHLQEQLLHAQKMDALGRLAGGVAHDFNNLLMAISGSAELLAMQLEDPTLRSSAQDIIAASRRAGELTEQLLAFSRQQPLERYELDLGQVIRKLERMFQRLLGRGVRLRVDAPEEPVMVRATEGLIQQALTNLVVNARDAVRNDRQNPGSIELSLQVVEFSEPITDLPEAVPVGRYACLCVADDGVGMSPELQAQVFEPFFTTKPPGEGTGLGLATVYSIARRCEGMVKLTSEPGEGSEFYLLLPLVDGGDEAASGDQP